MPLVREDDLVRIALPTEGEWVEVKRRLSRGDEVKLQQIVMKGIHVDGNGQMREMSVSEVLEASEFALLDYVIKKWSFDDHPTPANIRRLAPEDVEHLKAELNKLYPGIRPEEERRNLESNGATPSSAEERSLQP